MSTLQVLHLLSSCSYSALRVSLSDILIKFMNHFQVYLTICILNQ